MTANGSNNTVTLEIIRASEVTPREVKWLWYPYIPFGKITLLQGDPGDGKSKFMLALSALLTDGKPLPFQEAEEASGPMTVIYQTTEDDADDTVVPRFIASGGNRDNLIFIKENEKHLTFGDDRLQQAIERYNVKLLILDPLSSYIGEDCSMNDANKTRTELNHLIKIGQETGCAIVVVAHMNKNRDTSPLYRTNGSIDIAAAARSILAVARTQNKRYAESPQKPEYTLSEPKPTKMDPYKQIVDEWLEEAPYSALRILEKLREMGFDGGYSIVKAYVSSRKMDLNEKATVRFETMPGKQGQMDWGFFEDHLVYEDGKWKKLYCFLMILGYSRMLHLL